MAGTSGKHVDSPPALRRIALDSRIRTLLALRHEKPDRAPFGLFGADVIVTLALLALVAAAMSGCGRERSVSPAPVHPSPASSVMTVFVGVPPHAYLARQVGGERIRVETMVPAGQSPHSYEPTPSQVASLEKAAIYFRSGVPFEEGFISDLAAGAKTLRVVDLREGLSAREAGHSHDHGLGHEAQDPHMWLNPRLAIAQGDIMAAALAEADPSGADEYRAGAERLRAELTKVDEELREILAPLAGRSFHVFHPAFGYFADAYGLTQVAIEVDGKEPSSRQVAEIIEEARAAGARVIFVQPQFARASAEVIAREVGAQVVPLDPLPEDLPGSLMEMAVAIRSGLAGAGG